MLTILRLHRILSLSNIWTGDKLLKVNKPNQGWTQCKCIFNPVLVASSKGMYTVVVLFVQGEPNQFDGWN